MIKTCMIKAVIFDLDGLLIDTERIFFDSMARVLRKRNITIELEDYVGKDLQNGASVLESIRSSGALLDLYAVQREIYDVYGSALRDGIRPMPGAIEAVERLRVDYKLAIATSSRFKFVRLALTALGIEDSFNVIVSRESIRNLKPEPDCLRMVMKTLKLDAQECVLLEDSLRGLRAATKINMPCIVIPNELTREGRYDEAIAVVDSLWSVTPELISTAINRS